MEHAFLPQYSVQWVDGSVLRVQRPTPHPSDLPSWKPFEIAGALEFDMVAPAPRLADLRVLMATFARANTVDVVCELLDTDRAILARTITPPHAIGDNAEVSVLDLSGVVFTPGKVYRVRLSSPEASLNNFFAAYGWSSAPGRHEVHTRIEHFSTTRLFAPMREPSAGEPASLALVVGAHTDLAETDAAIRAVRRHFPDHPLTVVTCGDPETAWRTLSARDLVIFADVHDAPSEAQSFDALCFALYRHGVTTLFMHTRGIAHLEGDVTLSSDFARQAQARRVQAERCRYVLSCTEPPRLLDAWRKVPLALSSAGTLETQAVNALIAATRAQRTPHVAIVSVLYRKADTIERFLNSAIAQAYDGKITVMLIDDCSPDDDTAIAANYATLLSAMNRPDRHIQVQRNPSNLGNCASRLAGLAAVEADIYIIIDCDCMMNADFVAAHVFEHARDDVDVVIGPLNIETWDRDPADVMAALEANPALVAEESEPQDKVQPDGFLNCITRNFSVKRRRVIEEPLFDLDFSYSAKPDSGFGWEDVEMGYRLYARGAVIRYTPLALSVHCSHPSSVSEAQKVRGSMRNFARLFEKHPDLALAGRRWAVATYANLVDWAARENEPAQPQHGALDALFAQEAVRHRSLMKTFARGAQPLRILTYRWHVAHQYELYKLPHQFTLATGLGNPMVDDWAFDQRPLRPNVRMFHRDVLDPRKYDLAILHFDENILATHICNGVIPAVWGDPFQWLLDLPDIPKVAICHGTVQFEGQYGADPNRKPDFVVHEAERSRLVQTLAKAGVKVVCNSHQALKEWGFKDSRVIWHGFDPQQFPPGDYSRDILALNADLHRPHYRGAWEQGEVQARLAPGIRIESAAHAGAPGEPRNTNAFAERQFRAYVDRIRQFTAYLNTTLRSPMPRSRGEAMMTGVAPVCLRNHDVDMFIDNGKDGFFADTPEELADFLNHIFADRSRGRRIGEAARRKAMDVFNHDRYLGAWCDLISDAIGERRR